MIETDATRHVLRIRFAHQSILLAILMEPAGVGLDSVPVFRHMLKVL